MFIRKKEFAEAVLKYRDSEQMNPLVPWEKEGGYKVNVYTHPDDPNWHCLVGQVWLDLGGSQLELDECERKSASRLFMYSAEKEVRIMSVELQRTVDRTKKNWGEIINSPYIIYTLTKWAEGRG